MSEKRFFVKVYSNNEPFFFDEKQEYVEKRYTCEDVRNLHPMEYWQVVDLLNEQQATIRRLQDLCGESDSENAKLRIENKKLKAQLREKEEDEKLYANEILELRETNKEHIKFKSLGGDY